MPTEPIAPVDACVFDAYGTLFDVNAAAARCQDDLGDKAGTVSEIWRAKQLQYTWLRTLTGHYVDFWQLTGDALDYALAATGFKSKSLRRRLMEIYRELDAYPEVHQVLADLKAAGMKTAILSNGSPDMLNSAVKAAKLNELVDEIISIHELEIYKPRPEVYGLACQRLYVANNRICFMSSNGWDAKGAAAYGYRVVWVNRFAQPAEALPGDIEVEITDLSGLPALLGL